MTTVYVDTSGLAKWYLAVARRLDIKLVAMADRVMSAVCKELGIKVAAFF